VCADDLTLGEKIGQLICGRYFDDMPLLEDLLKKGLIGALTPSCIAKSLSETIDYINHFQQISKYPLFIGFGNVSFSGGTDFAPLAYMRIGAARSAELAYLYGKITTKESRAAGFHIIGLPNFDVNTNPLNPIINTRSLGDNAELVAELALETCRGILDEKGLTCAMHFPGHGDTAHDTHIAVAVVEKSIKEMEETELLPYQKALNNNLLNGICTNHIYYPALEKEKNLPATFSKNIITGLLRNKMQYKGIIMSDSLTMKAVKDSYGIEESAVRAIEAGHDIILQDYASDPRITIEALMKAVNSGRINEKQINDSVNRILNTKWQLGIFQNKTVSKEHALAVCNSTEHQAIASRVAYESVTVLENNGLPLNRNSELKSLCISNGSFLEENADWETVHEPANDMFYNSVKKQIPDTANLIFRDTFSEKELNNILLAAKSYPLIIIALFTRVRCYHEDSIYIAPKYKSLIQNILNLKKKTVIINYGNPYACKYFSDADILMCTYSDCNASIKASVDILFGEKKASGRLPVKISDTYYFGYGLK